MIDEMENGLDYGRITEINGSILKVTGLDNPSVGYLVEIGEKLHLTGEILKIIKDVSIVQCFEETSGLELYTKVFNTEEPLSMELGPGLLKSIYDGIQRPLDHIYKLHGDFIVRGAKANALDREKLWKFIPKVSVNQKVVPGDIVGIVKEYSNDHCILVPPGIQGTISTIKKGNVLIADTVYSILKEDGSKQEFNLITKWPIRKPRPYVNRLIPKRPLITGTRVFDLLFPVAQGGVVAIPGGFGTGKTVVQHSLAKFANADVIVYIGCGERGNEMADLLRTFPELEDPTNKKPLMERTVMIANTSNMPVSAREASIFSGITIAEYWRDMGKNVLLLADSTSRWAEALREISGRLEEMPTEGGYPAYLADRLSSFYERAGLVKTLGSDYRIGSITVIGAVSPPGGDFSEPVTSNTKRFIKVFWALDPKLAYARHYPSINTTESYCLYDSLGEYWEDSIYSGWSEVRRKTSSILSKANDLENIAKLVGEEALPPNQQLILFTNDLINNGFLIQNQYNINDRYSTPEKTMKLIELILKFYDRSHQLILREIPMFRIKQLNSVPSLKRARLDVHSDNLEELEKISDQLDKDFSNLESQYLRTVEW